MLFEDTKLVQQRIMDAWRRNNDVHTVNQDSKGKIKQEWNTKREGDEVTDKKESNIMRQNGEKPRFSSKQGTIQTGQIVKEEKD